MAGGGSAIGLLRFTVLGMVGYGLANMFSSEVSEDSNKALFFF